MNPETVIEILRRVLIEAFWVSLPLLAVGFVAGALISLIQIVTSIQDSSFGTLPRLGAFLLGLLIFLPWMLARVLGYTIGLLGDFSKYAR